MRQHTTTPLAIGEIFNTVWDFKDIIREQLIDYVRGAVTHMGGITRAQEDARLRGAVPDQVRHARPDRHLAGRDGRGDAPRPVDPQLRHPGVHAARRRDRTRCSSSPSRGRTATCTRATSPASASTLDVDEAGKYPYEQAYLPYNRLADGTVHDW